MVWKNWMWTSQKNCVWTVQNRDLGFMFTLPPLHRRVFMYVWTFLNAFFSGTLAHQQWAMASSGAWRLGAYENCECHSKGFIRPLGGSGCKEFSGWFGLFILIKRGPSLQIILDAKAVHGYPTWECLKCVMCSFGLGIANGELFDWV